MSFRPPHTEQELILDKLDSCAFRSCSPFFSTPALWAGVDSNRQFCLCACVCVCLRLFLRSQTSRTPSIIHQTDRLSDSMMHVQKKIRSVHLGFWKKGQKTTFISWYSAYRPPGGVVVLMKSDGLITYWAGNFFFTPSFALFQIQNGC